MINPQLTEAIEQFRKAYALPEFTAAWQKLQPLVKSPDDILVMRKYVLSGCYFGTGAVFNSWLQNYAENLESPEAKLVHNLYCSNLKTIKSTIKQYKLDCASQEIQSILYNFLVNPHLIFNFNENSDVLFFALSKLKKPIPRITFDTTGFDSRQIPEISRFLKKAKIKIAEQLKDPGFVEIAILNPRAEFCKNIPEGRLLANITEEKAKRLPTVKYSRFTQATWKKVFPVLEYTKHKNLKHLRLVDIFDFDEQLDLKQPRLKVFCKNNFKSKPKVILPIFKQPQTLEQLHKAVILTKIFSEDLNFAKNLFDKLPENTTDITSFYKKTDCLPVILESCSSFKQIYSLPQLAVFVEFCLKQDEAQSNFLKDCIRMLKIILSAEEKTEFPEFNQINTIMKLHDFCIKASRKLRERNFKLNLRESFPELKEIEGVSLSKNLKIVIPEDSHQLISWGNELHNCVGRAGYAESALEKRTIIVGIVNSENVVQFCIEIRGGFLAQFEGKYRAQDPFIKNIFINICKEKLILT